MDELIHNIYIDSAVAVVAGISFTNNNPLFSSIKANNNINQHSGLCIFLISSAPYSDSSCSCPVKYSSSGGYASSDQIHILLALDTKVHHQHITPSLISSLTKARADETLLLSETT